MNINILAVGKIKEEFYRQAVAEYAKRLSRFCAFNVIEVSEAQISGKGDGIIDKIKRIEGQNILSKAKGVLIALDLRGDRVSSEDIADRISTLATGGTSEITFIIGGSHGLSDEVLDRAKYTFSFGRITFPHQLMRVVLSEQIYRAFMINSGSEYHK